MCGRLVVCFLFFLSVVGVVDAEKSGRYCETRLDCSACHYCNDTSNKCMPVGFLKDPYEDCPSMCGVPMACGYDQRCVLRRPPTCICNFTTGLCAIEPSGVNLNNATCIDLLEAAESFTVVSVVCTVMTTIIFLLNFFHGNKRKVA